MKQFDYYKQREIYEKLKNRKTVSFRQLQIRDPNRMLIIDPNSDLTREQQIAMKVAEFTRNQNVGKNNIASMDDFKDLHRIEEEWGSLFEDPQTNDQQYYSKFSQFAPAPINRHWNYLAGFLNYSQSKMNKLKEIVE